MFSFFCLFVFWPLKIFRVSRPPRGLRPERAPPPEDEAAPGGVRRGATGHLLRRAAAGDAPHTHPGRLEPPRAAASLRLRLLRQPRHAELLQAIRERLYEVLIR